VFNGNLKLKVNIEVATLVEALQNNKYKHKQEYEKAVKVYFADLSKAIDKIAGSVAQGDLKSEHTLNMQKPVNNEKEYDKYINMLQKATDTTVEITAEEYSCIVEDNWSWAIQAALLNASYSSKY
jgi:hypothetical protein